MNVYGSMAIKNAKPRKGVYRLRPTISAESTTALVNGLNVAVNPSGGKTFWFSFTSPVDKKRKQVNMGLFPDLSLKDARNVAEAYREDVRAGKDPQLAKQQEEKATKSKEGATVDGLFKLYQADLEMDGKHTHDMVQAYQLDIQPFIGDRLANSITKYDIADLLGTIVKRGAVRKADIVRGYLMRAYNLGIESDTSARWRKTAPKFDLLYNPVAAVKKAGKSVPGNRVLSVGEVHDLWEGIGVRQMRADTALAVKLILATGQRVQEILNATWDEFDLDARTWAIPMERRKIRQKTQHSEPHLVPLTDLHIDLLNQLREITGGSQWLFPNNAGTGPRLYNNVHMAISRYCKSQEFTKFSTRDLRRTFKTLSGLCGLSKEIRDRLQGHAFQDVGSKNYDRYDYWMEKQSAMVQWSTWLESVIAGESGAVIQMKAANHG